MRRVTKEEVASFMDRFRTAKEIHDECVERGITGEPEEQCHCAVANLIRDQFPEIGRINVRPDHEICFLDGYLSHSIPLTFENRCFTEFAEAFDRGEFPELVAVD